MDSAWARQEMQGARVFDGRRITSLTTICEKLVMNTGVSFSAALGPASRQAAHRIFEHPMITPTGLLAGHLAETVRRCRAHPLVLVAQDTTAFDFSSHPATCGLGPTNDATTGWGLFGHSALALTPDGQPLGLLHLDLWARDPQERGKKQQRQRKRTDEKESRKWGEAHAAVEQALPEGPTVLLLQDRESDLFAFLARPRLPHVHFLLRAYQPRQVLLPEEAEVTPLERTTERATTAGQGTPRAAVESAATEPLPRRTLTAPRGGETQAKTGPRTQRLQAAAAQAPCLGELLIRVAARPGQRERTARVVLRACRVRLLRPRSLTREAAPAAQELWVLRATEIEPPPGVSRLDWVLLTTWPVEDGATAGTLVGYYARRWGIERLHQTLKQGLRAERLQIDDVASLQNALALLFVVAWRLLYVTHAARTTPDASVTEILSDPECQVLARATRRALRTVREGVRAIAKLGGWEEYPAAGEPGVLALWRGLSRLQAMVEGWLLAQEPPPLTQPEL